MINTNGETCLGDNWVTVVVVDVVAEGWDFSVVLVLVSEQLADEGVVVVTVVSGKAVEVGGVWDDGINYITTEKEFTENSEDVDLSVEDSLVNLG